mmetsp:Transcript_48135/g.154167  ORF Transcript_48135/g.154167 Transcript_48135/m.154167 type:complete len:271 (+) Transcript_48135:187-999(+)
MPAVLEERREGPRIGARRHASRTEDVAEVVVQKCRCEPHNALATPFGTQRVVALRRGCRRRGARPTMPGRVHFVAQGAGAGALGADGAPARGDAAVVHGRRADVGGVRLPPRAVVPCVASALPAHAASERPLRRDGRGRGAWRGRRRASAVAHKREKDKREMMASLLDGCSWKQRRRQPRWVTGRQRLGQRRRRRSPLVVGREPATHDLRRHRAAGRGHAWETHHSLRRHRAAGRGHAWESHHSLRRQRAAGRGHASETHHGLGVAPGDA